MESEIVTIISSVGFPIAACLGMFYLYDKTIKELTVTLTEVATTLESMKEELKYIREYEKEHHV